jgi:outer membrane receptor protein involved in Fe transport
MQRQAILTLSTLLFLLIDLPASAQTTITGSVLDAATGQPLAGVNVTIENRQVGTATSGDGSFSLQTQLAPPFVLAFSYVGYETLRQPVSAGQTEVRVQLKEQSILGQEVVVAASRVEESILSSPVSIEKLGLVDIKQAPSPNFYDGLSAMKGVDMTVHGLLFRLPNTRGFNGNNNYRTNQIIDGVDNISPGLSYAAGNIFGLTQLDIESVEMLVGASSALYGPGGVNGTILMTSKNPFDYQGLSASVQTGMMHVSAPYRDLPAPMGEFNVRYARAFNNRLAFKVNAGYILAEDWHAADYRDKTNLTDGSLTRLSNEGYDGVNVYGDDVIVPVNLQDLAPTVAAGVAAAVGLTPGTPAYDNLVSNVISLMPDQIVTRTGFVEKDLVDYNTRNFRTSAAAHYRITENLEAIAQGGFSNGTSVFTAQNRFSLRDFRIGIGKLEIKSPDFYVRAYGVKENSGNSYDAGATGLLLNEAWKPSELWYGDYIAAFVQQRLLGNDLPSSYRFARLVADNRDPVTGVVFNNTKPALPVAGTPEFESLYDQITSTPAGSSGSEVIDRSGMLHLEGMYNFQKQVRFMDWIIGGSYRWYSINSEGTIFTDEPGDPLGIYQVGAFTQISRKILADRFKLTASARYDKNEKFKGRTTPRVSVVYALNNDAQRNVRASYQTAFRFPSTSDQLVDLNTGRYHVVGGLPEAQNKYGFDTNPVYPLTGNNPIVDEPVTDNGPFVIPPFGPEKVTALELGYRGLHLSKKLLVDAYVYSNRYDGFLAIQSLAQNPDTPQEQRYNTTISTDEEVSTFGWALGADYMQRRGYLVRFNINYNKLESGQLELPGFQSAYNTPDFRFNLGVSNRKVYKNIGFSVNYRWQNEFFFASDFGSADMPAIATLDAALQFDLPAIRSVLKVGGSNLTNQYYTTNFGSAQIGGLYYVSLTFDDPLR